MYVWYHVGARSIELYLIDHNTSTTKCFPFCTVWGCNDNFYNTHRHFVSGLVDAFLSPRYYLLLRCISRAVRDFEKICSSYSSYSFMRDNPPSSLRKLSYNVSCLPPNQYNYVTSCSKQNGE